MEVDARIRIILDILIATYNAPNRSIKTSEFNDLLGNLPNASHIRRVLGNNKIIETIDTPGGKFTKYISDIHPNLKMAEAAFNGAREYQKNHKSKTMLKTNSPIQAVAADNVLKTSIIKSSPTEGDLITQFKAELYDIKIGYEDLIGAKITLDLKIESKITI